MEPTRKAARGKADLTRGINAPYANSGAVNFQRVAVDDADAGRARVPAECIFRMLKKKKIGLTPSGKSVI